VSADLAHVEDPRRFAQLRLAHTTDDVRRRLFSTLAETATLLAYIA
jgi:hypothetical protein